MNYPGDNADPVDVARWMSNVAEEEFDLPGILPVMTSCVELTSAWTGPGDVKTVPGYLYAQDHDSLGYFQQRPSMGWGTPQQLVDADYALRAFCKAAKDVEDNSPADTPEQLGAWCQAVQRSAYPERYAEIGYPMAKELLDSAGSSSTDYGWYGWESDTSWNLVYHGPDVQEDGGLWQKWGYYTYGSDGSWNLSYVAAPADIAKPKDDFSWPESNEEPNPNSAWYVERCPTRYSWAEGGRTDVEAWARYLIDSYPGQVWVNTYHHHPEEVWIRDGVSREYDSMDVWAYGGRGYALAPDLGDEIFKLLFYAEGAPYIDWIIWQAVMYGEWNGWQGEPFGEDDFSWHMDHIHVSYR